MSPASGSGAAAASAATEPGRGSIQAATRAGATPGWVALPRAPVFGWDNLRAGSGQPLPAVDALASRTFTTSGRAALFHALHQLGLPAGSRVLVPTYHCPTIVAPVLCAGMVPSFFGIGPDGLPDLSTVRLGAGAPRPGAIIAAHYFGLPKSMAALRAWCDEHGIALIEDCAHSYFGQAGERPVGAWGDFATASISKFFPVPEAGVLASAHRAIGPLRLAARGARAQAKGVVDVIELGTRYQRFAALNAPLAALFRWKNGGRLPALTEGTIDAPPEDEAAAMRGCDMGRIADAPLWVSMQMVRRLPRARIVERRRANFARFLGHFGAVDGARCLVGSLAPDAAPYVFPLWIDDADRVYHALRLMAAPAFRWDHVWPGTPRLPNDQAPLWNRHVVQLLCHQDLAPAHIDQIAHAILHLLSTPSRATA